MIISVNDNIPQTKLYKITIDNDTEIVNSKELFNKNNILIGIPGAFTPVCHNKHIPDIINNSKIIKSYNIDNIYILMVNDKFVVKEWIKSFDIDNINEIVFLADTNADFINQTKLILESSLFGHIRSTRFMMIIKNNIVKYLNIEDKPNNLKVTDSLSIINILNNNKIL